MERAETKNFGEIFKRSNPTGFGYEIIQTSDKIFNAIYKTADINQVREAFQILVNGGTLEDLSSPNTNYEPQLLTFNEKHGDAYFLIHNDEELFQACLKKLIERKNEHWYDYLSQVKIPVEPEISEDDIHNLPQIYQSDTQNRWKVYKKELYDYNQSIKVSELISEAIQNNDTKLAYSLIKKFNGGEYEGFEISEFESLI